MSEYSISATLKAGTGYDSPWVVVYGNTPEEVEFKLNNIAGVIKATVEAAELLKAANAAAPLAAPAASTQPTAPQGWGQQQAQAQPQWSQPAQQAAPQQQGARLHPEGKACRCGNVLNFKVINRKSDGKVFQFWECPARSGANDSAHDSEFAN